MEAHHPKSHIEILPAALLYQRQAWQQKAEALPAGTCLLVADRCKSEQMQFMQILAQLFREKGRQVILWNSDTGKD